MQLSSSRNFNKCLSQKRLNLCWSTKTLLFSKGSLLLTSSLNKIRPCQALHPCWSASNYQHPAQWWRMISACINSYNNHVPLGVVATKISMEIFYIYRCCFHGFLCKFSFSTIQFVKVYRHCFLQWGLSDTTLPCNPFMYTAIVSIDPFDDLQCAPELRPLSLVAPTPVFKLLKLSPWILWVHEWKFMIVIIFHGSPVPA